MPLMLRPTLRLLKALVSQPTASLTTLLYYSNLLPRNLNIERFVRSELLRENYLFHILIGVLGCFW
ncbi:hypothetical protein Tsubulata_046420 [Turnera subulata]|uniref:Uncharacterized protein n=1 Tax=Turnera subulata TaxID=218843 RepID=A0A9Q0JSP4_9ROSI|nr:hypothetical protein Tsubulata_046420 [Turnera subulata]